MGRLTAEQRFIGELQYITGAHVNKHQRSSVDYNLGKKTLHSWEEYKQATGLEQRRPVVILSDDSPERQLIKQVQSCLDIHPDGVPGRRETWPAWIRFAYADVLPLLWHPMPKFNEFMPVMSSGFSNRGSGPGSRYDHLGCDLEYKEDDVGENSLWWMKYRFKSKTDRLYFCPPVPVLAMAAGDVVYAKWKYERFMIKIDHGVLPVLGRFFTWSVHHKLVHVEQGDIVKRGEMIATAGETGAPGAPHNHQEGHRHWGDVELGLRDSSRHKRKAAWDIAPLMGELLKLGSYATIDMTDEDDRDDATVYD